MKRRLLAVVFLSLALCLIVPGAALATSKSGTRLSMSVSSSYEHFDLKPTVTGRLVNASGAPVAKATVKLYCGSTLMGSKRTDEQGKVRFKAELPDSRLSGSWKLKYAGSSTRRSAVSSAKVTRVHVHYRGAAELLGVDGELDEDGSEDLDPDEWVTLPESKSSAQLVNSEPGLDPTLDPGAEPGLDPTLDDPALGDDGEVPDGDGTQPDSGDGAEGETYAPTYPFGVELSLGGGRTYGITLSEPAWCRVDDSSGESLFTSDECADVYEFTPEATGSFALLFDPGLGYEDLDELNVLIW